MFNVTEKKKLIDIGVAMVFKG